jgi:hypothetical protein
MSPFVLVLELMLEPREHPLSPLRRMLAQARAAEVDSLAIAVAKGAFERVAVGALQGDAVVPE